MAKTKKSSKPQILNPLTTFETNSQGISKDGPCGVCMAMDELWKDRVVKETVVYNSKIQVV